MALAAALPHAKPNSQVGSVGQVPAAAARAAPDSAAGEPPAAPPLMTWQERTVRGKVTRAGGGGRCSYLATVVLWCCLIHTATQC